MYMIDIVVIGMSTLAVVSLGKITSKVAVLVMNDYREVVAVLKVRGRSLLLQGLFRIVFK
jgi:hypothetical protein